MDALDFFQREMSEEEVRKLVRPGDSVHARVEWLLRNWDYEKTREDAIRQKGDRLVAFHTLAVSSLLGAFPVASAILAEIIARPTSSFLLFTGLTLAILSAVMGFVCGWKHLSLRFRHVLDPTLALRGGGNMQEWHRDVVAHVLVTYKKNVRHVAETAFNVRLALEWLVLMLGSSAFAFFCGWLSSRAEAQGPVFAPSLAGMVVGFTLFGLAFRQLVVSPVDYRK